MATGQAPRSWPYLLLYLGMAEGVVGQVICEVLMTAVRGLHLPTEEQHSLWAGIWPRQDPLFVYTAQHLQGVRPGLERAWQWSKNPGATQVTVRTAWTHKPRTTAPSSRAVLTVTEPKLCSKLALWLSVGDVPWITLRKWPQMQRSISWQDSESWEAI